jgi:hypothetical protein
MRALNRYQNLVLAVFVFCSFGCGVQWDPPIVPQTVSSVQVIQTGKFVSFYLEPKNRGEFLKTIEVVQQATEQWIRDHPEYVVKDFSTSSVSFYGTSFHLTLRIEKE